MTEETAHANDVVSSGVILGDLVNTVPLMLHGLSIIRAETRFFLLRVDTPLSDVAPTNTTHVSLLNLFKVFPFFDLFVI